MLRAAEARQGRAEGAVLGALLGDALALQTHYEYDYKRIRDFYKIRLNGTVEKLGEELRANAAVLGLAVTPGLENAGFDMRNWHPGKQGGDLTDHGDCIMMAFDFLETRAWSLSDFDEHWWEWIQSYQGYVNFATKAIVRSRRAGRTGPDVLGLQPGEDLFAVCRLPALLYLHRDVDEIVELTPSLANKRCDWSETIDGLLEPQPLRVSTPFASESEAKGYCELLGTSLCGGVSCWNAASSRACVISLPEARPVNDAFSGEETTSWVLKRCVHWDRTIQLMRAAIESASVQYATPPTFAACAFLAAFARLLVLHGGSLQFSTLDKPPTRDELKAVMWEAMHQLQPRDATFIAGLLDAVLVKLSEVERRERDGTSWSTDPVEVDDLALISFARVSDGGGVVSLPYPCEADHCDYWEHHGKASPTVPGLVAVLYLFLRYAGHPLDHVLAVNAMLGGDSAARGVPLGMLLGALHGKEAVPSRLLRQLRVNARIRGLLSLL